MRILRGIHFSSVERYDLFKAWGIISLAFAVLITGNFFSLGFVQNLIVSGLTVGIGFIFHEMGHKFVAQRYGYFAEFEANYSMLVVALISSFFGFLFAAPGAVVIRGNISRGKYGRISLAGPLMSIVIALVFLFLGFFFSSGFFGVLSYWGFRINAWLAVFNLIPFGPLDGRKVLDWNRFVYFVVLAVAVVLMFVGF